VGSTETGSSPGGDHPAGSNHDARGKFAAAVAHNFLPAEATLPSDRQRLFVLFFTGALIDLVVLGLFNQYTDKVYVKDFTTALLASIVLQALLKLTIAAEHRILARFNSKQGAWWKAAKFFVAWLILFGSKFVILEALSFAFSHDVHFKGVWHGIVWLIIVVLTMVIVEELFVRLYRKLA
jgi:hypothetical protein